MMVTIMTLLSLFQHHVKQLEGKLKICNQIIKQLQNGDVAAPEEIEQYREWLENEQDAGRQYQNKNIWSR